MAVPRRSYAALKETQQQVDEELNAAPAVAAPSRPEPPEPINESDLLEAQRAAYAEVLREKVKAGRIPGHDMQWMLSRFDNDEHMAKRQAEDAMRLREARELAEAAAAREEAEQAQETELERDELER